MPTSSMKAAVVKAAKVSESNPIDAKLEDLKNRVRASMGARSPEWVQAARDLSQKEKGKIVSALSSATAPRVIANIEKLLRSREFIEVMAEHGSIQQYKKFLAHFDDLVMRLR